MRIIAMLFVLALAAQAVAGPCDCGCAVTGQCSCKVCPNLTVVQNTVLDVAKPQGTKAVKVCDAQGCRTVQGQTARPVAVTYYAAPEPVRTGHVRSRERHRRGFFFARWRH